MKNEIVEDKICLIYNFAQHYRLGIFKLLDRGLKMDFYFGDKMGDIKKLNYGELSGFKGELKNIRILSNFYWQSGAVKLFFKDNYQSFLLLGEYYCISTWLILFFSLFSNKKVYLWSHGWYGKEGRVVSFIKKIFFSMSDAIFLYGEYAKKLMVAEGIKETKLHVIYNSLDYENQIRVRKSLSQNTLYKEHFGNDDPILFFIGRLTKVKKLDMVIDALDLLRKSGQNFNLVIVGNGEEREYLIDKCAKLFLDKRVWFVGELYSEDKIGEYIFNADLCISPGNVGLTAMHSLVYGTPVITHDDFKYQMPEFEAVQNGYTGLFFQKDNLEDLYEKIMYWKTLNFDRQVVRQRCFQVIDEKYNPQYQYKIFSKNLI
ncbi:glycosyl transferase family 1 [Sphingobacterium sp. B29]|uniref:glycosyltransferase family 4 protein n=1 Tax=Sphingobacterium sp. B29 TaxID=1933220 RepID=UPI000957ED22|nr:glycosyltransferase family 4 protein [Sphingobacterium sp. B29]APU95299.1 glycosyl transferase family 1 [Sphingobacterium sp. B29]